MFTGIIQQQARIDSLTPQGEGRRLVLDLAWPDCQPGESIAVNGVCLTALPAPRLSFDLSPETLAKTTFQSRQAGDLVSLERAMSAQDRFGGHYVSGHVDGTARVAARCWVGDYLQLRLSGFSREQQAYLLPKGSITVDGVSLTINAVQDGSILVLLVPHTLAVTHLAVVEEQQDVNIEFDYLTRIVAHQIRLQSQFVHEV